MLIYAKTQQVDGSRSVSRSVHSHDNTVALCPPATRSSDDSCCCRHSWTLGDKRQHTTNEPWMLPSGVIILALGCCCCYSHSLSLSTFHRWSLITHICQLILSFTSEHLPELPIKWPRTVCITARTQCAQIKPESIWANNRKRCPRKWILLIERRERETRRLKGKRKKDQVHLALLNVN